MLDKFREEYIGKIMTREKMEKEIPGVWVAIRATKYDPESVDNILQGRILAISDDENIEEELQEYEDSSDRNIRTIRTSYDFNSGFVSGLILKAKK